MDMKKGINTIYASIVVLLLSLCMGQVMADENNAGDMDMMIDKHMQDWQELHEQHMQEVGEMKEMDCTIDADCMDDMQEMHGQYIQDVREMQTRHKQDMQDMIDNESERE